MRERAFGVGFQNSPAQTCANIFDVADRFRVAWHTTGVGRLFAFAIRLES